ncbi:abortive infection family protein [Anabaena catenula]|uniref:Abortive infection family protein n=1 Tax=Anabaena catenula FACHB-362 TaxID=2692877 RepID=A0ABR8J933_9NOST|nr:abortive infection family protein [Anabaena catenula]MBD2694884.1 abortive infection family protein [Anabaena catenula FACHB-362]
MESLESLVKRHFKEFPDFQYYGAFAEFISTIESYHQDLHTGISLDCCNSLLQSICKTIITQIDPRVEIGTLDRGNSSTTNSLVSKAAKLLQKNDDIYEKGFISEIAKLGRCIADLRNARGDVSHGRRIPKELVNDQDLSRLIRETTESLSRYLISSFFSFALEKKSKEDFEIEEDVIRYEDNPEFNDLLDEEYPLDGKLLYSQALYSLYYEDYDIRLQTFLDE